VARTLTRNVLLDDLDLEQREAVLATEGPVVILAGAGTGKTRVISRRTAYAIETGVVPADQVLVVTFTEKAAGEMVERLRELGLPGVTARTFHAQALRQLRHFWPSMHGGDPLPELLDSKLPILIRLVRALPGHYRFTPSKDIADEIEWSKSRRIGPEAYATAAEVVAGRRSPPIPADLFVKVYADYERAKARARRIDFDDLLVGAVDLLESNEDAAAAVRARKRWFSVDEYQDTNPLQQRLLELWLGDREDVCVVGDEDQTIYSFTGATSDFLTGFAKRHPGARVLKLTRNYRSTSQVLELANRLLASQGRRKRLEATRGEGPETSESRYQDGDTELRAVAGRIQGLIEGGLPPAEIAVLVRMNAQLEPVEVALTRAGIPYQVRGLQFYERAEVVAAIALVRRAKISARGEALRDAVRELWQAELGYEEGATPDRDEARERAAALDTLLHILDEVVRADPAAGVLTYLEELGRRGKHEREGSAEGVNLLTYHRAKGLEWDAVFLPMLEDGTLPVRQAFEDEAALAEERRLLYVGLTRARVHLALSWAERRDVRGRETRRQPSRFLRTLRPPVSGTGVASGARQGGSAMSGRFGGGLSGARGGGGAGGAHGAGAGTGAGTPAAGGTDSYRVVQLPDGFAAPAARAPRAGEEGDPLFTALRAWRTDVAQAEGVPAYVVAHDATLSAIAEIRPRTMSVLRRVRGMGPAKLDKYGEEILAVVAQHA
jgi:DNA helicase II / ATP-dependent DNA helicase PcrA